MNSLDRGPPGPLKLIGPLEPCDPTNMSGPGGPRSNENEVATLASFLEAHNVAYEADSVTRELSNTQRAERAEASSAQLECRK